MSSVSPTESQLARLLASKEEGPVVMLNLLKFKADGGQQAYARYAEVSSRMIQEVGGRILYAGRWNETIVGEPQDWDAIAMVEYPSRRAFIEMVSRPDYQEAHKHREEGLERAVLNATTPLTSIAPPEE